MAVKLPETIKIGFATYRVVISRDLEPHGDRSGTFVRGRREICLSDTLMGDKLAWVLLHEILHGIYSHWSMDEGSQTEERVVSSFTEGLATVLKDNPDFGSWLIAQLK